MLWGTDTDLGVAVFLHRLRCFLLKEKAEIKLLELLFSYRKCLFFKEQLLKIFSFLKVIRETFCYDKPQR